jgi:hypothetical protein
MRKQDGFWRTALIGLVILSIGVATSGIAQDTNYTTQDSWGNPTFGMRAGVSWSNWFNSAKVQTAVQSAVCPTNIEPEYLTWYTVGLYYSYDLIPSIVALQPEFSYWRGGKRWANWPAGGDDHDFSLTNDYVHIPLLVKFQFPVVPWMVPYVAIGPHLAINFRARGNDLNTLPAAVDTAGPFWSRIDRAGVLDYAKNTFDVGYTAGGGIRVPLGFANLDFDFRYIQGTLNVYNFSGQGNLSNYAYLITGGISFNLGRFASIM